MLAAAFSWMWRCRTVSVSGFRRIGRRLPDARPRWLAPAARLTHLSPCLNGSGHWRIGLGSQGHDREPALLALLAWEERLVRWQRSRAGPRQIPDTVQRPANSTFHLQFSLNSGIDTSISSYIHLARGRLSVSTNRGFQLGPDLGGSAKEPRGWTATRSTQENGIEGGSLSSGRGYGRRVSSLH